MKNNMAGAGLSNAPPVSTTSPPEGSPREANQWLNYPLNLSKDYRDESNGLRKHPHKDVDRNCLKLH